MGITRHDISVLPHIPAPHPAGPPWLTVADVGRFITLYLLAFYVIFECVLNVFAEATRFADRGFYDAWWNSTTWDQV